MRKRRCRSMPKTPRSPNKTDCTVYFAPRSRSTAVARIARSEPKAASAAPLFSCAGAYAPLRRVVAPGHRIPQTGLLDVKRSVMLACGTQAWLAIAAFIRADRVAACRESGQVGDGPRRGPPAEVGGETTDATDADTGRRTPTQARHRPRAQRQRPLALCAGDPVHARAHPRSNRHATGRDRPLLPASVGSGSLRGSTVRRSICPRRRGAPPASSTSSRARRGCPPPRRSARERARRPLPTRPLQAFLSAVATGARADDERVPKRQGDRRRAR